MPAKSKPQPPPDDDTAELRAAVGRLADLIEILSRAVESLTSEIQWQNNEQSQDYVTQHLPLTRLPSDPTTKQWHPEFGNGLGAPTPVATTAKMTPKSSRLFD